MDICPKCFDCMWIDFKNNKLICEDCGYMKDINWLNINENEYSED